MRGVGLAGVLWVVTGAVGCVCEGLWCGLILGAVFPEGVPKFGARGAGRGGWGCVRGVGLAGDPLVVTEVVGCAGEDLRAGLDLEVVFSDRGAKFRPRGTSGAV
ncbi:conserved hypothetical protein [Streptomyces sviceus ATCC 29083]|uniref:Uncharacterized protein n=1 Tax=Streptomyces sviceus (strain ATCC 29083 / DSM 924 / JCM 4929 / NBRC 13980 / NCIMB 11184 / NRRL 5439 / UC 5370) TaxID=463191 RepID=B5HL73_STRX2|nr:conserved hypothetical protein [Streptomyces sviceus ATCC 29083]